MKDNNLHQLRKVYMETPIPKELDFLVRKTLKNKGVHSMERKKIFKKVGISAASVAASIAIFTVGVNFSPAFASSLAKVPVVSDIVEVLTFRGYTVDEDKYKADIKVPSIQGLENKALEKSLNEKYLSENKKLYEEFKADMDDMKENVDGHLGVDSGYVVKTDTDKLLSIGRYVVNTVGSSSTTFKYDTIDKEKEILITLPSLFKDNSYVEIISENIKEQMREQMKSDPKKIYWVAVEGEKSNMEIFNKISENQSFYINYQNNLVISFDKYEIAPGYMGVVEFIIPTDVISDILVGNEYVK